MLFRSLRRELDKAAERLAISAEGSEGRGFVREDNRRECERMEEERLLEEEDAMIRMKYPRIQFTSRRSG